MWSKLHKIAGILLKIKFKYCDLKYEQNGQKSKH